MLLQKLYVTRTNHKVNYKLEENTFRSECVRVKTKSGNQFKQIIYYNALHVTSIMSFTYLQLLKF